MTLSQPKLPRTCCHIINIQWTPNIFPDYDSPIKLLLVGLNGGAPEPPNPPYSWEYYFFWGGVCVIDPLDPYGAKYVWEAPYL